MYCTHVLQHSVCLVEGDGVGMSVDVRVNFLEIFSLVISIHSHSFHFCERNYLIDTQKVKQAGSKTNN